MRAGAAQHIVGTARSSPLMSDGRGGGDALTSAMRVVLHLLPAWKRPTGAGFRCAHRLDRIRRAIPQAAEYHLERARSNDLSCYVSGKVQSDRLAKTSLSASGLERVRDSMKTLKVALMCAEKDPLACHRTILVTRRLNNVSQLAGFTKKDDLHYFRAGFDRRTRAHWR
jgi:hypothetical protein